MKNIRRIIISTGIAFFAVLLVGSCSKTEPSPSVTPPVIPPVTPPAVFDINSITDTYESISSFAYYDKWSVYNVHDPSVIKVGDYYYSYSTDVGFGIDVRSGIQVRKSKGLVEWSFEKGRDWENKKSTFIFTGLNNSGTAVWGKKKG